VAGLTGPVLVYNRNFGISITGGYVVRQPGSPLYGQYIFGDYGFGTIYAIPATTLSDGLLHQISEATNITAAINGGAGGNMGNIVSFGEGPGGELYVVGFGGKVVMVVHAVPLSSLTVSTPSINAGSTGTGTVSLASPAAVDTVVSLSSSNPTASVPSSVVVPQGATSADFSIAGFAITRGSRSVGSVITATLGANSSSVMVQVVQRPANP
jgi:hypothetical protein